MDMSGIDRQNREFDALTELAKRWDTLQRVAVVDDDYPQVRRQYEGAMRDFLAAIEANGRLRGLMSFDRFSEANKARCESSQGFKHPLNGWSLSDWFLAALGELGEAANVGKKLNRVRDGIPGNKEAPDELRAKLRREIADTFIYLDLAAQSEGFRLGDAVVEVFNAKSAEIGYPTKL